MLEFIPYSGSVFPEADPDLDPHQNEADPKHWGIGPN